MQGKEFFTKVYDQNLWGSAESVSGCGSNRDSISELISGFRPLLDKYQIRSLFDCPCGDWAWMQHVDLTGISYVGADIVDALVEANHQRFAAPHVSFRTFDILTEVPPAVDAIFIRDLFIHFSLGNIHKALRNIARSGATYLLTSHHLDRQAIHVDGKTKLFVPGNQELGGEYAPTVGFDYTFRPLHFCTPPFEWPEPIDYIREAPHWWGGGKSQALWRISDLPLPV